MEEKVDSKLPFLDVNINNENSLITSVYHKPTFTGLYTNFHSFSPFQYKIGLIRTLVDRIYKINNNWFTFDSDINKMIKTLGRNAYPPYIIEKVIKNYLNKKFESEEQNDNNTFDERYFKLPYIGKFSSLTKGKLMIW